MSGLPGPDPRASEMRGHHARLAELRQIRERVDYIDRHTTPFMWQAVASLRAASPLLADGIANYERGIEAAYKAGATRQERLSDDERTCPQCFDYVENCGCGRKGKA